jgi:hypothetical protein
MLNVFHPRVGSCRSQHDGEFGGSPLRNRKAPGKRVDHHNQDRHYQELRVLFYLTALDLSRSTLNYMAGIARRRRKKIASTWRLLNPGHQALLVLTHLRKEETFAEVGAGFGVTTSTAWRTWRRS